MLRPSRHLSLALALVIVLLAGVLGPPAYSSEPRKHRAQLVIKSLTVSLQDGQVTFGAVVRNKGRRNARPSGLGVLLSRDTTASPDDLTLGTVPTPRVRARRAVTVGAVLAAPGQAAGRYFVLACADVTGVVKEAKEGDNCRAARVPIDVPLVISAAAGPGGSVSTGAVSGGSCLATTCTFPFGTGAVTFTPTAAPGMRFAAWTGCAGYLAGPAGAITFTNPVASAHCTATFEATVKVTWSSYSNNGGTPNGSVGPSVSPGVVCTVAAPAGSCTTGRGVGTITLTAEQHLPYPFVRWTGCQESFSLTITITAPATDQSCVAVYKLDP